MDQGDLSLIRGVYRIPWDFELELHGPDAHIDYPPPGRVRVYEEAFEVGLKFPILPFIFELLKSYEIPLYVLTPNSIRYIVGFLGICFMAEIQSSLSLFYSFFTT